MAIPATLEQILVNVKILSGKILEYKDLALCNTFYHPQGNFAVGNLLPTPKWPSRWQA